MELTETEQSALKIVRQFQHVVTIDDDESTPRSILVDAMLRLYHDDDDEPITREWMDAAFPERNSAWWYLDDTLRLVLILDDTGHADIWVSDGPYILADADHEVYLREVKTRGEVREFLRGMGLDTKGGN